MATILEVARLAGVSKSTVSRVLNGVPVSDEARRRVDRAIAELRFRPNAQARGLPLGRNHLVGVVVPEIARMFYGQILAGIERALAEAGYEIILCSTGNRRGRELNLTKMLQEKRVDGLILVTPRECSRRDLRELQADLPVVFVDGASDDYSSISVDNYAGGFMAADHLRCLGHRRIAMITGLTTQECADRLRGYRDALEHGGLAYDSRLVWPGDYLFESGFRAMAELLDLADPPTAVFAASDLMAIGALKCLEQRGLKAPGNMAVVGFDDLEAAEWTSPTLTTVRQPLSQLGEWGGRTIVDLIDHRESGVARTLLRCELAVRESCGAGILAKDASA